MASTVLTLSLLLALTSPQFWSRIGISSQLQPLFILTFAAACVYRNGFRIPRNAAAQMLLIGWTILLIGGVVSIFFVITPELFLQELVRRVALLLFLWSAASAATAGRELLQSTLKLSTLMIVTYAASMVLYYAGWSPLRDFGYFDAYPFGLLIPVAVYSNPLIFSETQLLAYFLIAAGMLAAVSNQRGGKWTIAIGLMQFGKGPMLGYVASLLPRTARSVAVALTILLLVGLWLTMGAKGPPSPFDGDYGSLAERKYHAETVLEAMVAHPLHGMLGYGLRQYGSYLATQTSSFGADAVPLSVVQWIFESGIPIAVTGLLALLAGSLTLPRGRLLSMGVFAFVGHLALPNPADTAVLLVFALIAGEAERSASTVG